MNATRELARDEWPLFLRGSPRRLYGLRGKSPISRFPAFRGTCRGIGGRGEERNRPATADAPSAAAFADSAAPLSISSAAAALARWSNIGLEGLYPVKPEGLDGVITQLQEERLAPVTESERPFMERICDRQRGSGAGT